MVASESEFCFLYKLESTLLKALLEEDKLANGLVRQLRTLKALSLAIQQQH